MQKETVTFDKLPEAVGYLSEQVIELKRMVSELQHPTSANKIGTPCRCMMTFFGLPKRTNLVKQHQNP